ncbi:mevalonate kinase family protein [Haliangium sp.]|uniref:mevalonate kinase family protein n=1 Tax=Haliangium sp. TaxID=2663208 RepID=UPI003D0E8028
MSAPGADSGRGSADSDGRSDDEPRTSAPGKVLLAGEYAVLDGAEAVIAAVNRRVVATVLAPGDRVLRRSMRSPFLRAVRTAVSRHAGPDSVAAERAGRMYADSGALRDHSGPKLGLGSSAAVTVAACACALARDQPPPTPALIHTLAHAAHGDAQLRRGARGSGADVAASVYGGVVAVQVRADPREAVAVRPLAPTLRLHQVHLVFVWTGTSASTPALVSRVQAWRGVDPRAYERTIAAVGDAAAALIASLAPGASATDIVAAVAAGGEAAARLGRDAGVAIETDAHLAIAALARARGGAAKPTGAGGGDIALVAFSSADAAEGFRTDARAQGFAIIDMAVDPHGVRIGS